MSEESQIHSSGRARVVVVGGGLAGLAAAEGLSRTVPQVTVLEARPRLGGRATSFDDKTSGTMVDNCQHVSMGCCTYLKEFCRRVGIEAQFKTARELTFIDRLGQQSMFASTSLPAPFHLAHAFAKLKYFNWSERLEIATGLRRLAAERRFDGPFEAWLLCAGQSERVRRLFWHVVLVSALSESLDRVATQVARKVFIEGFFSHRSAWEVELPSVSLDQLYGRPVIDALESRGVEIRLNTAVRSIQKCDQGFSVELRSGEVVGAETCVVAVPHHRVSDIVSHELRNEPAVRAAASLESAPITSVHLWFDRQLTELPHAVFVEHLSQWMFRKGIDDGRHYYQVVISASHDLAGRTHEEIVDEVVRELKDAFSNAAAAALLHSRIVTEKRAVFSPTPESQPLRPSQQGSTASLFFAGDWTSDRLAGDDGGGRSKWLTSRRTPSSVPIDVVRSAGRSVICDQLC